MALPTPPPPPEPPSSTSAAATTTTNASGTATRPLFPPNSRPPPHHYQNPFFANATHPHPPPYPTTPTTTTTNSTRLPSNPNPYYPHLVPSPNPSPDFTTAAATTSTPAAAAILYPVASSGRGFLPKQPPPPGTLTNPNPNSHLYPARPGLSYPRPPFGFSDPAMGPGLGYVAAGRPSHLQQGGGGGIMPGVIKGVPISAANSQSQQKISLSSASMSDCNGHKDLRERIKDDAFVTIRDRKVRISDNASVYALCRSWLRNGFPEESQLQYLDSAKSLPRPLPLSALDDTSPEKKEDDKEIEEDNESVEHLTSQELLQKYVKRAKRVRSRLREERLRRIARYKTRLALLLPPMVDPHIRNDMASGN